VAKKAYQKKKLNNPVSEKKKLGRPKKEILIIDKIKVVKKAGRPAVVLTETSIIPNYLLKRMITNPPKPRVKKLVFKPPAKIIHIDDLPQYLTKKTNPNNPY